MDITKATQPNSQQVNADDIDAPIIVTVTGASEGTDEQPLFISLAEFPGRTYRPGKSMARIIRAAWGGETNDWTGVRQIELFRDPTIRFGPKVKGGIRISKISHIDGPLKVNLTVTRGEKAIYTVEPLPATDPTKPRDWLTELALAGDDLDAILALGNAAKGHATAADLDAIRGRYNEIKGMA